MRSVSVHPKSGLRTRKARCLARAAVRSAAILLCATSAVSCDAGSSTTPPAVAEGIRLDQTTVRLDEGATSRLRVLISEAGGRTRELGSGSQVVWTVSDPQVASVVDGLISALRPGSTRVTAAVSGKQAASADVIVLAVPGTLEILSGNAQAGIVGRPLLVPVRIRVLNRQGRPFSGAQLDIRTDAASGSVTPAAVTVDQDGMASLVWTLGTRAGEQAFEIRVAGRESILGMATARAAPGPVATVQVTPKEALTIPGGEVRYSAVALDEFGNMVPHATLQWATADGGIATIDVDGRARAVGIGDTDIEAIYTPPMEAGADVQQAPERSKGQGKFRSNHSNSAPAQVSDLNSPSQSTTTVTLSFTQVGDGMGEPANYEVRYAETPIGSGFATATVAQAGTCASPIVGTLIGARITCTVDGLQSGRSYDFQIVAFRGVMGAGEVSGPESNVVTARTSSAAVTMGSIEVVGGNNQLGSPGTQLATPLTVRVKDTLGAPMANVQVNWSAGSGTLNKSATTTDAQGLSSVSWTLGTATGTQSAFASAGTLNATFTATSESVAIASVSVSPASTTLKMGESVQLSAEARDAEGTILPNVHFNWYASDPTRVMVSSSGMATGLSAGSTTVLAAASSSTGSSASYAQSAAMVEGGSQITVEQASTGGTDDGLPAIVNTLAVDSIGNGMVRLRFTEVNDGTGQPANYSMRYHVSPIGWNWGSAMPVTQGTCSTLEGMAIGNVRTCTVLGLQTGVTYDFQMVSWRGASSNPIFSAGLSNVVTATSALAGGNGTLAVSPRDITLNALGATQQLSVVARDASGTQVSNPGVVWQTSNSNIATVNSNGMLTARGVGTALITATATCCVSDQITVTIQQSISSVSLSPTSVSVPRGQTIKLSATAKDANGYTVNTAAISWNSSNASVATVAADGTVYGAGEGNATITASSSGKTASSAVVVDDSGTGGGGGGGVAGWINQPSDITVSIDEAFSSKTLSAQNGGSWSYSGTWWNSDVTLSGSNGPQSPSGAIRWIYRQGRAGGDSPGRAVNSATSNGFGTYYIGFWIRWSLPWTNHATGTNKIMYWGETHARAEGRATSQFFLNRRGPYIDATLQYAQSYDGMPCNCINSARNLPAEHHGERYLNKTPVDDGNWHLIEMVANASTNGQPNGRMRVWVDGVIQWDLNNLRYSPTGDARFYGIDLDPVWGGIGDNKPQTEWLELDHLRIGGR